MRTSSRVMVGAMLAGVVVSGAVVAPADAANPVPRKSFVKLPSRAAFGLDMGTLKRRIPPTQPSPYCGLAAKCLLVADADSTSKSATRALRAGGSTFAVDYLMAGRAKSAKAAKARAKSVMTETEAVLLKESIKRPKWRKTVSKGSTVWRSSVTYLVPEKSGKPAEHAYIRFVLVVTKARMASFSGLQSYQFTSAATPKKMQAPLIRVTKSKGKLPLLEGSARGLLLTGG